MTITDRWVLKDGERYFSGLSGDKEAFLPLCADTRTYRSERAANCALRRVVAHYESPYIEPFYIDHAEIPDKLPDASDNTSVSDTQITTKAEETETLPPLVRVPYTEQKDWIVLDTLCGKKPAILRKERGGLDDVMTMPDGSVLKTYGERFALIAADGEMYYLPGDELFAWQRYFAECERFVCDRIRARRAASGLDPNGMDEWRDEK